MIIFTSHSSEITSPTPGGTAETEMRNTFGLETTRTEFTPASGVLTRRSLRQMQLRCGCFNSISR